MFHSLGVHYCCHLYHHCCWQDGESPCTVAQCKAMVLMLVDVMTGCFYSETSIKDTVNEGCLSNEDTVCSVNDIELCTNLLLN